MSEAAERGSSFFLGIVLLPGDKREALSAVYAYCRLIDDIVDSGHLRKEEAARLLDYWRGEVARLYAGAPTHSVSLRLARSLERVPLPREAFLEMIRGCAMDLEGVRYPTFADLQGYMRGVACSVGRLCVEILGYRYTSADAIAEFSDCFGYAFQLTNIIRDVGADLDLGRVYLPEEDMKAAGYSYEELKRREHNPAFDRLMALEYERARSFYRRGRSRVDFRDRPGLLAAEVMAHVYEGLLEEIRLRGFRVLFGKTELPSWRKAQLAFKAWLYCQGLHGL